MPAPTAPNTIAATESAPLAEPSRSTVVAPTDDELSRTVVAVFGDSAALHPTVVPFLESAAPLDGEAEPIWDIDVRSYETHDRVAHYVQLFSTSSRGYFRERLSRGTRYEPMIRAKLRASGMPEDLTYLALIESGYDPHAYSRAAAVGMWQFMSGTARAVGLRVDWWVDERRDPARSTEGAIRFLSDLQKQFGSLYLAAAAYNGGPGRVARGLTRYAGEMEGSEGEDRFFALAEQDYLRAETKNYVPQLIAAALIAKMPSRYGLSVDSLPLFAYDSVLAPAGTSLSVVATASSAGTDELRNLNPAMLRGIVPPDADMWVHVPAGSASRTAEALTALSEGERVGYTNVRVSGATTTLASLAARHGIEVRQLGWFNPGLKTSKRGRLSPGQSVRVPTRATLAFARSVPDPSIERYGGRGNASLASRGVHVVRRGETLGGIARKYGLSVSRLKALNGIKANRVITGQTLRVRSTARTVSSKSRTKSATVTGRVSSPSTSAKRSSSTKGKGKSVAKSSAKSKGAGKGTSSANRPTGKKPSGTKPSGTKPTGKKKGAR